MYGGLFMEEEIFWTAKVPKEQKEGIMNNTFLRNLIERANLPLEVGSQLVYLHYLTRKFSMEYAMGLVAYNLLKPNFENYENRSFSKEEVYEKMEREQRKFISFFPKKLDQNVMSIEKRMDSYHQMDLAIKLYAYNQALMNSKSIDYVIEQFRKKRIDVFDVTKINYEYVLMKRELEKMGMEDYYQDLPFYVEQEYYAHIERKAWLEKRNIDYVNIEDEKKRGQILSELDEQIPVLSTYDRLVLTKKQK